MPSSSSLGILRPGEIYNYSSMFWVCPRVFYQLDVPGTNPEGGVHETNSTMPTLLLMHDQSACQPHSPSHPYSWIRPEKLELLYLEQQLTPNPAAAVQTHLCGFSFGCNCHSTCWRSLCVKANTTTSSAKSRQAILSYRHYSQSTCNKRKRCSSCDSPTMSRACSISGRMSSTPGTLPLRSISSVTTLGVTMS